MKKTFLIMLTALILVSGAYAKLNLKLEGAGSLELGDDTAFMLDGGGIVNVNEKLAVRFLMLRLQFDPTAFYLSTGARVDALIFFPMANTPVVPYGIAGLEFHTMEDYSEMYLNLGGGAEFGNPRSSLHPFAELVIGIISFDTPYGDDSDTVIALRGGIRYDLGIGKR